MFKHLPSQCDGAPTGVLEGLPKSTKINKMQVQKQESRLVVVTKCHIQGLGLEWEGEKSPTSSPNDIERLFSVPHETQDGLNSKPFA